MFLCIINEVLWDFTPGMVIIAAENLDQAREIFVRELDRDDSEFNRSVSKGKYRVLQLDENAHREPGLIDHVWGGG